MLDIAGCCKEERNMEQTLLRKSIFELERRTNLKEESDVILEYLRKNKVRDSPFSGSLFNILNQNIKMWKYRGTAFNIEDYLKQINVRLSDQVMPYEDEISDIEILYFFELLLNLIRQTFTLIPSMSFDLFLEGVVSPDKQIYTYEEDSYLFHIKLVLENVVHTLEQINMTAVKVKDRIIISKRNPDVDSVLEIEPSLSEVLLEYLDFRNAHDIEFKRMALKQIADYLEPRRKSYKGTNEDKLCNSLFFAFNNFHIRHNDDNQIPFSSETTLEVMYDKIFIASLHLIRGLSVRDIKNEIDKYKKTD